MTLRLAATRTQLGSKRSMVSMSSCCSSRSRLQRLMGKGAWPVHFLKCAVGGGVGG